MIMTLADAARIDDGGMAPRAERPKRRMFTAECKAKILGEYDAAEHGERGAILRREGLYSSDIVEWRRAAEAGAAAGLGPKTPPTKDRRDRQIEQLRTRAESAEAELAKTKAALDLVGNAHALLETLFESTDTPKRSQR